MADIRKAEREDAADAAMRRTSGQKALDEYFREICKITSETELEIKMEKYNWNPYWTPEEMEQYVKENKDNNFSIYRQAINTLESFGIGGNE